MKTIMQQTTQNSAPGTQVHGSNNLPANLANLMYCVATGHNIGVWNGSQWNKCVCPWTVTDMVFDNKNRCWIVGTGGNVGILDLSSGTVIKDYGLLGGWKVQSIDFDADGNLWCVGTGGNVGCWNGYSWDNHGMLGGWTLQSISVRNLLPGALCWGVNTSNELGIYDFPEPGIWTNDFNGSGPFQSVAGTPPTSGTVYIGTVNSKANDSLLLWNEGGKIAAAQTNWTMISLAFMPIPKS